MLLFFKQFKRFDRKFLDHISSYLLAFLYKSTLCLVEYIKVFDKNRQNANLRYQLSASLCKNVKQQSTT